MTEQTIKAEKNEAKAEAAPAMSGELAAILKQINGLKPEERKALGLEMVKGLTVLELSEWVKSMEAEFGVSAAAPVAVAAAAAAPAEAKEEKTAFTVVLTGAGDKKIQVIKEVRAITSLGLKEAKDLVEGVPKPVKEGVAKKDAEDMKKKIADAGGTAEIK